MKHELKQAPSSKTAASTLAPERPAAEGGHRFARLDPETLGQILDTEGEEAANGDLWGVRDCLAGQVAALDRMFLHFFELATEHSTGSEAYERLIRLSMRAQLQSARTAAILGRLPVDPPADQGGTTASGAVEDPPEPKGDRPERTDWLPETCGPDCASHLALWRMTRWANKSPVAIGILTRRMNGEDLPVVNAGAEVAA